MIVEKIKRKILPRKIEIELPSTPKDTKKEFAQGLGFAPFIWYGSHTIDLNDLSFFELNIVDGLPTVKIIFRDPTGMMDDRTFPFDDTKISVFINPRTTSRNEIFIDFKIVEFRHFEGEVNCIAVLDVNQLHIKKFASFKDKTSYETISSICTEIGIGFFSNTESSNDKMTWINTGNKVYQFLNQIMNNSYLSEGTFALGYIDYFYNYVYVDLEKELSRDLSEETGVYNAGYEEVLNTKKKEGRLFLTNDNGFRNDSNFFFERYTIINKSTSVSLTQGYKSIISYYNHLSKEYLQFKLDSLTKQDKSKVIMKGFPNDDSFRKINFNYIYGGKLDTDNMHLHYNYAENWNDRNLIDLEKVGIELEMMTPNFNLFLFQKITVIISNNSQNVQKEYFNRRLTGEWLIINIKYRYIDFKFSQIITLVKRELNISPDEPLSKKKSTLV
jgi:hypothetical protein